jgi:hypothetical protein
MNIDTSSLRRESKQAPRISPHDWLTTRAASSWLSLFYLIFSCYQLPFREFTKHNRTSLQVWHANVLHFWYFCEPTFSGATREWEALYYPPTYVLVFLVVSFPLAFPQYLHAFPYRINNMSTSITMLQFCGLVSFKSIERNDLPLTERFFIKKPILWNREIVQTEVWALQQSAKFEISRRVQSNIATCLPYKQVPVELL